MQQRTSVLSSTVVLVCAILVCEYSEAAEKFRPSTNARPSVTFRIQDEDGQTHLLRGKRVGSAIIYQDDILITESEVQSATGIRRFLRWDDGIIPFFLPTNHPYRQQILQAVDTLNRNTVLWYKETTNVGSNHISIVHQDGCYSGIGMPVWGDSYPVSIGDGCQGQGTIIHELLHAAGLFHEQSRKDRNQYVRINWNNIIPAEKDNFEMTGWRAKDIGYYNYHSIMHYGCRDFAVNPARKTIDSNPINRAAFGQRVGLSAGDVDAIAAMYYNVSPNRGKPVFTPTALPQLTFPAACTPPVAQAPTPQQCEQWASQIQELRADAAATTDINEKKQLLKEIGRLVRTMQTRGCN